MVVPSGWHHAVVNLSLTLAVTANFVDERNAAAAYAALRERNPAVADEWRASRCQDSGVPVWVTKTAIPEVDGSIRAACTKCPGAWVG